MTQDILTLRQDISKILFDSPPHVKLWENGFTDAIETMTDESEVLKRVNLFWNIYLAKSRKDLFEVRNFLSDDISIKEWKKRFTNKVVPSILRYVET